MIGEQQLGRVVVTTKKPNPNGIVFDFTNNAQNLIYNNTVTIDQEETIEVEETENEKAKARIDKIKLAEEMKAQAYNSLF